MPKLCSLFKRVSIMRVQNLSFDIMESFCCTRSGFLHLYVMKVCFLFMNVEIDCKKKIKINKNMHKCFVVYIFEVS